MAEKVFDVIVIGTGAGGGMAIKILIRSRPACLRIELRAQARPIQGLPQSPAAVRSQIPGFGDPKKRAAVVQLHGERERRPACGSTRFAYTTAPGTEWMWPRCFAVGGKTNFWGRSSARFAEIDFKAASLDGFGVDWPITYAEIAPYYVACGAHDRRREHRPKPSEQSRRRVPAPHRAFDAWIGFSRLAPRRSACRICPTESLSSR